MFPLIAQNRRPRLAHAVLRSFRHGLLVVALMMIGFAAAMFLVIDPGAAESSTDAVLHPGEPASSSSARHVQAAAPVVVAGMDRLSLQDSKMRNRMKTTEDALCRNAYLALVVGLLSLLIAVLYAAAAAKRVSRSRHRVIFERHPLPILVHSTESEFILEANPAAAQQYGYSVEELCSLRVSDLLPEMEGSRSQRLLDSASAGFVGPWPLHRRDGSSFIAEVSTTPVEGPRSDLRLSVVADVTDRVRTLDRLSAEEARFRSLTDSLAEAVLVTDLEGMVTYVNPRFEEITGRPASEVIGLHVEEELEEDLGTTERPRVDRRAEISDLCLRQYERPNGETIWLEIHSSPLFGAGGQTVGVVSALTDATARVETELALRERESRLRTLLQQVPAVVWTTNRSLEFTSMQGGIVNEELSQASSLADLIENGLDAHAMKVHRRALEGHVEAYEIEYDGRDFRCQVEPYHDEGGEPVGVVGVGLDITEEKRAAAEHRQLDQQLRHAQKMEAVGRLAGGIAHDFNNLLTVIYGNAELLGRDLDGDEPTALMEIRQAATSAASLTRQLLAFSRRQHLQLGVFELDEAVAQACKLMRRVIGEDIVLELVSGCPGARVKADSSQIHQVLLNLAINARDAMPRGGRLEIRTDVHQVETAIPVEREFAATAESSGSWLSPGEYLRLQVADNGFGMAKETLQRSFEPFFTTKQPDVGTGLGLATVHGIVRQSGGYIGVRSVPGEGTTFTILLPSTDELSSSVLLPTPLRAVPQRRGLLLLVEDELAVRRMLACGLRNHGYEVLEAGGGVEAEAIATELGGDIDLLVSDILMPDCRGTDLAEILLDRRLTRRALLISGYPDEALGSRSEEVDYLPKPFTVQTLVERIEEKFGHVQASYPMGLRRTA